MYSTTYSFITITIWTHLVITSVGARLVGDPIQVNAKFEVSEKQQKFNDTTKFDMNGAIFVNSFTLKVRKSRKKSACLDAYVHVYTRIRDGGGKSAPRA